MTTRVPMTSSIYIDPGPNPNITDAIVRMDVKSPDRQGNVLKIICHNLTADIIAQDVKRDGLLDSAIGSCVSNDVGYAIRQMLMFCRSVHDCDADHTERHPYTVEINSNRITVHDDDAMLVEVYLGSLHPWANNASVEAGIRHTLRVLLTEVFGYHHFRASVHANAVASIVLAAYPEE